MVRRRARTCAKYSRKRSEGPRSLRPRSGLRVGICSPARGATISAVTDVDARLESCLRIAEALLDAMRDAISATDPGDPWRFASYRQYMRKYNDLLASVTAVEPVEAPVDHYNLDAVPGLGDTLGMQQQSYFESVRANLTILRAYLQNRVNPKSERIAGIADFLEARLRRAMMQRPDREKDVQDVVEQLLIGRGMEKGLHYDRESGRVKYSALEVIPDFVLLELATAIEVKLLKDNTRLGTTIDEINADIQSYSKVYDVLVVVVYDVGGVIRDDAEFRRDLEATDGVRVLVIKHQPPRVRASIGGLPADLRSIIARRRSTLPMSTAQVCVLPP